LNRLARLLGTGYGGQVLLTEDVRERVATDLPPGVTLRDLGRHRLRDLLEPEQVGQLVIAGLPDHFAPLKSLERHPTNIPIQPTVFVGREAELADVGALLTRDEVRLLTLTGVGGCGKTRLALQAAAEALDDFEDGAFVVDLASVADAELVLSTIAQTLGVREGGGLTCGKPWSVISPTSVYCCCSTISSTWWGPRRPSPRCWPSPRVGASSWS
jgi:hypothetical protein